MNTSEIQRIIDIAVNTATKCAMNGHPVAQIIWILPQSASQQQTGAFAVVPAGMYPPSIPAPWEI